MILFHRYDYYWADGDRYKKPTAVSARQYVQLLMDWTDNIINDEEIFPHDTSRTNFLFK